MFVAAILIVILAGFVVAAILTSRAFWLLAAVVAGAVLVHHFAQAILTTIVVSAGLAVLAAIGVIVWCALRPPADTTVESTDEDVRGDLATRPPHMPVL